MSSSNATAISARDLGREYRMGEALIRAVNGISLEIESGEFVALLGASGSGKSTLLNLIAGLDRPSSGSITVNGRELAQMSAEELARYRRHTVGMVFQAFNLIPTMTLLENVELPMRFAEVDRAERAGRAREALERVGLSARSTHRPPELSGGEQQRASIARALVNRPSLLLADEPTGNLDSRTGEEIMNYLRECHDSQGLTVLLVTHERALADRYAQRILTLADGRLVDDVQTSVARVSDPRNAMPVSDTRGTES
jgi:putative ABC transport system ATP-binding protein